MGRTSITRLGGFVAVALPALAAAATIPAFETTAVDLDFKNAKIQNVLRLLSDAGRVNIWISPDVNDEVTIRVSKTPVGQVIDRICRERALYCQRNGNVVLISHAELPPSHPYVGKTIEPNFRRDGHAVDLRAAMATLAEAGQVKIEVAEDVRSTVDMKGYPMPWDQVLDVIVWAKGLRAERAGDVIRIVRAR